MNRVAKIGMNDMWYLSNAAIPRRHAHRNYEIVNPASMRDLLDAINNLRKENVGDKVALHEVTLTLLFKDPDSFKRSFFCNTSSGQALIKQIVKHTANDSIYTMTIGQPIDIKANCEFGPLVDLELYFTRLIPQVLN